MDEDIEVNQKANKTDGAVFEFTKRKRWADTLISELVNCAVFVFSNTGTILHCDAAVHSVTGYTEDQLVSKNFAEFLHDGDTKAFFKAFDECIAAKRELTFYLRIKAGDRRDTRTKLIELKANPYYAPGSTECLCVFAILTPYPSPSVTDLDDFLALRIENERLQLQLEAWKNGEYSDDTPESDSEDEESPHRYHPEGNIVDISKSAMAQAAAAIDGATTAATYKHMNGNAGVTFTAPANGEPTTDGQPTKKKRRMTESTQGRVCTACGRNNSPEWRKGPQGPKTLCNACGLRWAKKTKGSTKDGEGE